MQCKQVHQTSIVMTLCTCQTTIIIRNKHSTCVHNSRNRCVVSRNNYNNANRNRSYSLHSPVEEANYLIQAITQGWRLIKPSHSVSLELRSWPIWRTMRMVYQWASTRCHQCQVVDILHKTQLNLQNVQECKTKEEMINIWKRRE